jgi:hypothetical protein
MSGPLFPQLDEVELWHHSMLNGLDAMQALANVQVVIPRALEGELAAQIDEIRAFTFQEWLAWRAERVEHQEMFATIALFASFEGMLKRDFAWRATESQALHHYSFLQYLPRKADGFVPLARILACWKSIAVSLKNTQFEQVIENLERAYQDERNALAHGNNITVTPFPKIYADLVAAKLAFHSAVPDFL